MFTNNTGSAFTLSGMADEDLLLLRANLDAEMRTRKIAFSVGEVGEVLTIEYFKTTTGLPKLQKAPTGTKNVDALSRNGDRYSIKTICKGKKTGTVYPDSENPDKQLFEYLLITHLTDAWHLKTIHQLPWDVFREVRSWDRRMNAWYVPISGRSLSAATAIFDGSVLRYD
ncbi:hypothetical protein FO488_04135 [Geobacter sp. FeAm09]|uniref:hypothetical protein n=1 Tax=Geobacter sp. FeAm09 TaxID=2597769 RepID=UPI0011F06713|nr:hypothetical protein [Geobacter sp. FeAm09]QEM67412.1 hypothetical protein FO488_04135 [Geobacter sp. FeAm09]